MKKDITELFCIIDDFCKLYEKYKSKKLLLSGDMIGKIIHQMSS